MTEEIHISKVQSRIYTLVKQRGMILSYSNVKPLQSLLHVFILMGILLVNDACSQKIPSKNLIMDNKDTNQYSIQKTEAEWKEQLTDAEFHVLRNKGTERPYTSEFEHFWEPGVYVCKGCGAELFEAKTKFDAGCGWPSFYKSINPVAVKEILDKSHGMVRTEVVCAKCGGHLGHVFNDGFDQPTGLRYCINGVSLGFKKKED